MINSDLIAPIFLLLAGLIMFVYQFRRIGGGEHVDYRHIGAQVLELTAELTRLAYRILALEKVIAEHENGIALLVAQVRALDPAAAPAYHLNGMGARDDRGNLSILRLYELLAAYFTVEELVELMFTLGGTGDEIGGDTRAARAQEMVMYFNRRGRLNELARAAKDARPKVQWPYIEE